MADTTNISQESDFGALVKALRERGDVDILSLDDRTGGSIQVVAVTRTGGGRELVSAKKFLDDYRSGPERREGIATLITLGSFCDHVKRFMDSDSVIFADVEGSEAKLIAVLDYNRKGAAGLPRFGKHRGIYKFPLSDEWLAWKAVDGKAMDQERFARFLEDRILDVLPPSEVSSEKTGIVQTFAANLGVELATPQRLMELSNGLSIRVDTAVTNAINIGTGEGQINFQETHVDGTGGPVRVPKGFAIGIPVFKDGQGYQAPVRLRYRVDKEKGKVNWTISLWQIDQVWNDAISTACDTAHADTGLDLLYGRPET